MGFCFSAVRCANHLPQARRSELAVGGNWSMTGGPRSRLAMDEHSRKGVTILTLRSDSVGRKLSDLNCPDTSCPACAGLPQDLWRGNEARAGSLCTNKRNQPHSRTGRGVVRDSDRLAEPIWRCCTYGIARSAHRLSASEHPGVKRAAYRVHGLSIRTQELAQVRRCVAHRLTHRSRVMGRREGGVPVVVGGRESRSQGEGEQIPGSRQ